MSKSARGKSKKKSDRLTITLYPDQRRGIEEIAKRLRTSAATVIRWALDEYIGRKAVKSTHPKPR